MGLSLLSSRLARAARGARGRPGSITFRLGSGSRLVWHRCFASRQGGYVPTCSGEDPCRQVTMIGLVTHAVLGGTATWMVVGSTGDDCVLLEAVAVPGLPAGTGV